MTALPGTPQIQNLIPMKYYHTTPTAGAIMGIAAALVMAVGGYFYLRWRENTLRAAGEIFDEPQGQKIEEDSGRKLPSPVLSFLPLVVVVTTLNLLGWNIIPALIAGIILIMLLNTGSFKQFTDSINSGAGGSVTAIINTSAAVGFGAVVQAVPGFQKLTDFVMGIKGSPLISQAVAINILAGSTGSASGGMGIALEALGAQYYQLAMNTGISPEAFHRIASIASGGLDTLPHNGAVLTLLAITGLTHRDSYRDIFVVGCLIPIASVVVAIMFGAVGLV
jgi:H+/gluconate symporter-like permease